MNAYSFPDGAPISTAAKSLITLILNTTPEKRPSISEILAHDFLNPTGTIPKLLPIATLTAPPTITFTRQYSAPSNSNMLSSEKTEKKVIESPIARSRISVNLNEHNNANSVLPSRVPAMHTYHKSSEVAKPIFSSDSKPSSSNINTAGASNYIENHRNNYKDSSEPFTQRLLTDTNNPYSAGSSSYTKRDLLKEKKDFINTDRLNPPNIGSNNNAAEIVTFESDEHLEHGRELQTAGGAYKRLETHSVGTRLNTAGSVSQSRGIENLERTPSASSHTFQSQGGCLIILRKLLNNIFSLELNIFIFLFHFLKKEFF